MFTVTKRMEISGAHFLRLNYESKCTSMHGHKWLCDRIPHCIRVAVQETEGNTAVYEK